MEDSVRVAAGASGSRLLDGVRRLWASGRLCDVALPGPARRLPAHALVLAAHSPVLRDLLPAQEATNAPELPALALPEELGEHAEQLGAIARFAYGHALAFSREELPRLLAAAEALQVAALVKALAPLAVEQLDVEEEEQEEEEELLVKPRGAAAFLLVSFRRMWEEEELVDVVLATGPERRYAAHKLVLAALSTYLETGLVEGQNGRSAEGRTVVSLEGMDPLYLRQLPLLLDYMYGKRLCLPPSKAPPLRDAAKVLGVHGLVQAELVASRRAGLRSRAALAHSGDPCDRLSPTPSGSHHFASPSTSPLTVASLADSSPFLSSVASTSDAHFRSEMASPDLSDFVEVDVEEDGDAELPSAATDDSPPQLPPPFPVRPQPRKRRKKKSGLECSECSLGFPSVKALNEHRTRSHDGTLGSLCQLCPHSAADRSALLTHLSLAHALPLHRCKVRGCGAEFQSRQGLVNHADGHARKTDFLCPVCPYSGRTKANLRLHLRSNHGREADGRAVEKSFDCGECSQTFVYASLLRRHFAAAHLGERAFRCPECPYAASSKAALGAHHRAKHSGDKPFLCPACPAAFTTSSQRARHRRARHGAPANHACPQCARLFPEARELRAHLSSAHDAPRPFPCSLCSSAFTRKDHLLVHTRNQHPQEQAE